MNFRKRIYCWQPVFSTTGPRRWWRRGIVGIAGVVLLGVASWLVLPSKTDKPTRNYVLRTTPIQRINKDSISTSQPASSTPRESHLVTIKTRHAVLTEFIPDLYRPHPPLPHLSIQTPRLSTSITEIKSLSTNLTELIGQVEPVAFSGEETAITRQMETGDFGPDSTSYQALTRNLRNWPDAVLVCDFTTSMYPYSTQLFAWFRKNARHPAIKGLVFFTDCDSLGQQTRPGGPPGRMFITREWNSPDVLPTLLKAARNTVQNRDDAENDVEALLFAQKEFPEARHLILLADNISTVKDMRLLDGAKKPVHVVLCGTTGSDTALAFQPDYYAIARQTNGSLHTLEDDFIPNSASRNTVIRVGEHYYKYVARKNRFKLTTFHHRPKRFLNFIWL